MPPTYSKPISIPMFDEQVWIAFSSDYPGYTATAQYVKHAVGNYWKVKLLRPHQPEEETHDIRLPACSPRSLQVLELFGEPFGGWRRKMPL